MTIRKSNDKDISRLCEIFDEARSTIAKLGIDQWQDGYPSKQVIDEDIKLSRSYVIETDGQIYGTFVLVEDGEITYDKIYEGHWLTGDSCQSYIAIHRVAISVEKRGSGISGNIVAFASNRAKELGRSSLRIDTHEGNAVMRRMLEKNGFEYCGIIYLQSGDKRVAYEKQGR